MYKEAEVLGATAAPVTADSASISARIERLPFSPFHKRALTLVGMAHFFDSFDALAIAFVLPVLIGEWKLNPADAGVVIAIGYAGQTVGAIGIGWAAERWGRLRMVALSCWVLSLFALASAFTFNIASFMVMRFIQGIGLGGEVPTAATYINEASSAKLRGRMVFCIQTIFAFATAVTAVVALWMVPKFGWQSMYLVGTLPILLAMSLRSLLPESPRWLASRGRTAEADSIVGKIEADYEQASGKKLPPIEVKATAPVGAPGLKPGIKALLVPEYRSRTLSVWVMALCISLTGYGMLAWMPTLYRTVFKLPMETALAYGALTNVMSVAGALSGLMLVELLGRRKLFVLAFMGSAVPLVALWAISATLTSGQVVWLSSVAIYFISILLPGIYVYAPEIYPTRIRGTGVGVASAWLRIGSIIGPLIIGFLLKDVGIGAVFMLLGAAAFVGGIAVLMFGIETRGRTLEEIAH